MSDENLDDIAFFSNEVAVPEESNLVKHARRELAIIGEEQSTIDGIARVLQAFSDMGHSGGSASVVIPWINDLLQFKNLTPLTNDPEEWEYHGAESVGGSGGTQGIWQNRRNGEAFSNDGGLTYHLTSDENNEDGTYKVYTSQEK